MDLTGLTRKEGSKISNGDLKARIQVIEGAVLSRIIGVIRAGLVTMTKILALAEQALLPPIKTSLTTEINIPAGNPKIEITVILTVTETIETKDSRVTVLDLAIAAKTRAATETAALAAA